MLRVKKIVISLTAILFSSIGFAQHPDIKTIDNLKNLLPSLQGTKKIDCLNSLAEEYWWPASDNMDSIYLLANLALIEARKISYSSGEATSMMLLGVVEIYKRNFIGGEKYLRQALVIYENISSDFGVGWANIWLGQALYFQCSFEESLSCYLKCLPFLDKLGDWEAKGKAWTWMAYIYSTLGNYDSSFYYCSKSLLLRQKMSDHVCVTASLTNMGQLYRIAGSYEDALDYYRQSFNYASTHGVDLYTANWAYLEPVGLIYRIMNSPDSSYYYLQKAVRIDSTNQMTKISFAETLLAKKRPDSALSIFLEPIGRFRKGNDKWDLMRVAMDIAKAYEKKNNIKTALKYANESFSMARQSKAKHFMLEGFLILSRLYKNASMNDSAYYFLAQYAALKDSIGKNQFLFKLSNYKRQAEFKKQIDQLAFLDKENKDKATELRQKSLLQWVLVAGLLIAALSGSIFYKNLSLKRKNEQLENMHKNSALQQNITELEMQALRSQMNPHFIFNCLSSINRFILKNEMEEASGYLTKFSRLIRMVLVNSKKQFISLEDEMETLCLYLDMEKLRFKNLFDYKISFINSIDAANIFLPPLLLQPFAENAIWHGLMHKEGQGRLEIEISADETRLCCTITDNGVGRTRAAALKSKSAEKQKSMGLQMTTERIALLNKESDIQTFFNIEDIFDKQGNPAGTKVILRINYKHEGEMIS